MTAQHPAVSSDQPSPNQQSARTLAPDLARGLMLLFIALANVSWYLWGRPAGLTSAHIEPQNASDGIAQVVMNMTVDARIYPMFAFLFGYGMVQFARSRTLRGVPRKEVRRQLRRRHWGMLLIGFLHALLLFVGDIVGAYGLLGLLLVWMLFERRTKTIGIVASVLSGLLVIGSLLQIVGGIFVALSVAGESGAGEPGAGAGAPGGAAPGGGSASAGAPDGSMAGGFDEQAAREGTVGSNYLYSMIARLVGWTFATFGMVFGLTIIIAILLGWIAARHQVLENPGAHRKLLVRVAAIGIPVAWAVGLLTGLTRVDVIAVPYEASWIFTGITSVAGVCGGIGYIALIALWAHALTQRGEAATQATPVRALSAVGRRSLTFYLWQSVIFAPLLAAWGFGLGGHIGTAAALGIAVLVWAAGLPLALLLDAKGKRGPAEIVLRGITRGGKPITDDGGAAPGAAAPAQHGGASTQRGGPPEPHGGASPRPRVASASSTTEAELTEGELTEGEPTTSAEPASATDSGPKPDSGGRHVAD